MSKRKSEKESNKKSFTIIAIIIGIAGVGIGAYSIATVGTNLERQNFAASTMDTSVQESLTLMLNDSPLLGSMDAPITIVEYGDYQCPGCQRFATQVKPLIIDNYVNTSKAKLVFKDFTIYGQDSVNGAIATHCAGEQNKYWQMHDHLYENQKTINSGWLSTVNIENLASEVDLEMEQFKTCLGDDKYSQQVMENFKEGKSIGVTGIPTFIITDNDGESKVVVGAQPYTVFKQILDEMLLN